MEEIKDLQQHVDTVLSRMETITVADQEGYTAAGEFLRKVKQSVKLVEDHFAEELKAAQDKKREAEAERKAVADQIKTFTDKLNRAERAVKKIMGDYLAEEERKRRQIEAQRRKEEEDRRLAEAEETGNEEILDRPVVTKKEPEPPKLEGTYSVDVWEYEIVDISKINPEFLMPDTTAIGKAVRNMKDKAQSLIGPGVKVTCRKDMRVRV
jgi:hypothetical protein